MNFLATSVAWTCASDSFADEACSSSSLLIGFVIGNRGSDRRRPRTSRGRAGCRQRARGSFRRRRPALSRRTRARVRRTELSLEEQIKWDDHAVHRTGGARARFTDLFMCNEEKKNEWRSLETRRADFSIHHERARARLTPMLCSLLSLTRLILYNGDNNSWLAFFFFLFALLAFEPLSLWPRGIYDESTQLAFEKRFSAH